MAPQPKLTTAQIEEIRGLKRADPNLSQETLAERYNVSRSTIKSVLAAPDTAPGPVTLVPLELLVASPNNPRKTFTEDSIAEMAESIAANGIIQNLVVREAQNETGLYEIIAGERRMRALRLLASQERWSAPVPCVVKAGDDATFLALSLIENLQRENVPPLEEAEAITRLHTAAPETYTTQEIARRIGKSVRYVQQRIQIHRDATPAARAAYAHQFITFDALRVLAGESHAIQMEILATYGLDEIANDDFDPCQLQEHFLDGAIIAGDIKRELGYIRDREAREKATAAQAAIPSPEPAMRLDNPHSGGADYHGEPYEEQPEEAAVEPKQPEAEPSKPYTTSHVQHAHRRKSVAMQMAVVEDTTLALRLACLALLGPQEVVRLRSTVEDLFSEDKPGIVPLLDLEITSALGKTKPPKYYGDAQDIKLWRHLMSLEGEVLNRLFSALVARTVVTLSGVSGMLGDQPLAEEIAGALNIKEREHEHGLAIRPEDLQGLRKNTLLAIANEVSTPPISATAKISDIIDAIPGAIMAAKYVLPTMKFGSTKKIETEIAKILK